LKDPSFFIYGYIYREKKVFYNIEGQLRGFQGSVQPKTCAPRNCAQKGGAPLLFASEASVLAKTPVPLYGSV
jgi:hypothetical protein